MKESESEDDESDDKISGAEFGRSGEEFGKSGGGDAKGDTGGMRDNTTPLGEVVRGFGNTWTWIAKAAREGKAPSERLLASMKASIF